MSAFTYTYDQLFNPLLKAMHEQGGSATNDEIEEGIATILKLSDAQIEDLHRGNRTKLSYRTAWAKNYLKRLGLLENSSRAVWVLTPEGRRTTKVDPSAAKRAVKRRSTATGMPVEVLESHDSDASFSARGLPDPCRQAQSEIFAVR